MPLYRDEAIVLRTQKLGEADRIVTLLTRRLGKVRAVGKGVRRTKSRFGSRLEPGMHVDVQCYEGRSLDTVTQVETLDPWGDAIARDYPSWTAATAVLETCDRLTEEHEPALQQYRLLAGAVLTETVFSFPGVGDALAIAFREKDYAVLQVLILAAAVIFVLVNLLVDIAYALIDPRIRTR